MSITLADICAVAVAECFRDDDEILANPMGTIPVVGGRLARATFAPQLAMSDGESCLVSNDAAFVKPGERIIEYWNPYRSMFDWVFSGRRHVMMGASQIDRYGNQNIAAIGDPAKPKAQLLGYRGAPGNTINDRTSYWVPKHNRTSFVDHVDTVTGVGWDRAGALGEASSRYVDIHRVVSNLGVFDFETPDKRMRLRSLHPGVSIDDVVEATSFELVIGDDVPVSREPTEAEMALLDDVIDPDNLRGRELGG
ncbi:MAG TPA: CoA-transferase [Ilumatobacter sp.]|nr:CoA-transferase [Ilumatobacter sp.]